MTEGGSPAREPPPNTSPLPGAQYQNHKERTPMRENSATPSDYTTEELLAEMRRRMEAHWHLKLVDDLTSGEVVSLFRAYIEDTSAA